MRRSRPGWVDPALLGAVGIVVVLVSLPRLRSFALHDNAQDARSMMDVLGDAVFAAQAGGPLELGAFFDSRPDLDHRLRDAEPLQEGRLLRRHGYLFDLARTPGGRRLLRGWPWEHGHTGMPAYTRVEGGPVVTLPNTAGRYSGALPPPIVPIVPAVAVE